MWPTRCPPMRDGGRWRWGRCGRARVPSPAPSGARCCPTLSAERNWVADQLSPRYHEARRRDGVARRRPRCWCAATPTPRRWPRRCTHAGVPVEVVGLAGLLGRQRGRRRGGDAAPGRRPRRRAPRRCGCSPARAGGWVPATSPRCGAAPRTRRRAGGTRRGSPTQIVAQAAPDADSACLADAICDPGPAGAYSPAGYGRICALADELTALRGHLDHPLADLVAEVRRVLGVDVEVRPHGRCRRVVGTEHLDAFADVVAGYAQRGAGGVGVRPAGVSGRGRGRSRTGLPPAEVTVAADRVQVLTVHAAKGLEWQLVAVPHLSRPHLPVDRVDADLADRCGRPAAAAARRPRRAGRARRAGARHLGRERSKTAVGQDIRARVSSSSAASTRSAGCCTWRSPAPRTHCCCLVITGAPPRVKPRGPSEFLCELKDIIDRSAAAGEPVRCGGALGAGARRRRPNPLRDNVVEALWPADPAGARRGDVDRGAALVHAGDDGGGARRAARRRRRRTGPPTSTRCWPSATGSRRTARPLPAQLSVSSLVDLGRDPTAAAQRLRRRLPGRPDPHALLGTAFHDWVQRFYGAERLFDLDDLPGAVDGQRRGGRRGARRTAGRVHGVAVGGPHTGRRRGALRHGHRRHRRAGPHRRGVRRRRRRRTVVDWKTGRSAGHPGRQAARRGSARRLPVGVGGAARLPANPSARRSTTCGRGRSSSPIDCRIPTNWRPCCELPAA